MDEKLNDTQEKAGIKNLDMPELVQEEELLNTQLEEDMDETEMLVKNGTATSEWRDFWREAQKRREEKLQNTQSDEEEVNYLAKMIIERLEAKEKANKYLKNFKIK